MIFGWKLDDGWSILITLPFVLMNISFVAGCAFYDDYPGFGRLFGVLWLANLIVLLGNLLILGVIHYFRTTV